MNHVHVEGCSLEDVVTFTAPSISCLHLRLHHCMGYVALNWINGTDESHRSISCVYCDRQPLQRRPTCLSIPWTACGNKHLEHVDRSVSRCSPVPRGKSSHRGLMNGSSQAFNNPQSRHNELTRKSPTCCVLSLIGIDYLPTRHWSDHLKVVTCRLYMKSAT